MNYATHIISSFNDSAVKSVLVVDDAYDPPTPSEALAGHLLDVLEGPDLREYVTEEALGDEGRQSAIEALENNDLDDDAIANAISSLFIAYLKRRSAEIDPGGQFAELKGSGLEALAPLLELLGRCGDRLCIRCAGRDTALRVYGELRPDLILMDYFMSPSDRRMGALSPEEERADSQSSSELLSAMLRLDGEVTPAVILMSSGDIQQRAQPYRSSLEGKVTALRFGFLKKDWVQGAGDGLTAVGKAADVLVETSGSFAFSRALEGALRQWKYGAEAGFNSLCAELQDLDVKDFAYLLRFRLYDEGERIADYLEWFLGESLRAVVDDRVPWHSENFSSLNDQTLTQAIEGAHSDPSQQIAKLYHRIRFNSRQNRERRRFGLGDLFLGPDDRSIRMVITPDCDIVERDGSRRASRLLTVGGTIRELGDEKTVAGGLIVHDSPKAITWELKDLMSHEFTDNTSALPVGQTAFSYYATMRALVAQAIQKEVLGDLARVGLAVPPTVVVVAPVKVYLSKEIGNGRRVTELDNLDEAHAQVFMPRGGSDKKARGLFSSQFVRTLTERIDGTRDAELSSADRIHRRNWIENNTKVHKAMVHDGIQFPGEWKYKMFVSIDAPKKKGWLNIVVDVSEEALITTQGTDPLSAERVPG